MNLLPNTIQYCIINTLNESSAKLYCTNELTNSNDRIVLSETEVRSIWQHDNFLSISWVVLFSYDGIEWRTLRPTFAHYMFNKPYTGRSQKAKSSYMKDRIEFEAFKTAVSVKVK